MAKLLMYAAFCISLAAGAFYAGRKYEERQVIGLVEFPAEPPQFTSSQRAYLKVLYPRVADSLGTPEQYFVADVFSDSAKVCIAAIHLDFFKQVRIKGTGEAILRKDDTPEICFSREYADSSLAREPVSR